MYTPLILSYYRTVRVILNCHSIKNALFLGLNICSLGYPRRNPSRLNGYLWYKNQRILRSLLLQEHQKMSDLHCMLPLESPDFLEYFVTNPI